MEYEFSTVRKHKKIVRNRVECHSCHKNVYPSEELRVDEEVYHKTCFRCKHCNQMVSNTNFSQFKGVIYCKPHFMALFKTRGKYDDLAEPTGTVQAVAVAQMQAQEEIVVDVFQMVKRNDVNGIRDLIQKEGLSVCFKRDAKGVTAIEMALTSAKSVQCARLMTTEIEKALAVGIFVFDKTKPVEETKAEVNLLVGSQLEPEEFELEQAPEVVVAPVKTKPHMRIPSSDFDKTFTFEVTPSPKNKTGIPEIDAPIVGILERKNRLRTNSNEFDAQKVKTEAAVTAAKNPETTVNDVLKRKSIMRTPSGSGDLSAQFKKSTEEIHNKPEPAADRSVSDVLKRKSMMRTSSTDLTAQFKLPVEEIPNKKVEPSKETTVVDVLKRKSMMRAPSGDFTAQFKLELGDLPNKQEPMTQTPPSVENVLKRKSMMMRNSSSEMTKEFVDRLENLEN
jgi:hypothetical protein